MIDFQNNQHVAHVAMALGILLALAAVWNAVFDRAGLLQAYRGTCKRRLAPPVSTSVPNGDSTMKAKKKGKGGKPCN
jgi:hypothetical protein